MKSKNSTVNQIAQGFVKYLESVDQADQLATLSKIQQKQSWAQRADESTIVISAVTLKLTQKTALKKIIENKFNLKPKIKYQVDESIIGGLIIRVGNKILDVSFKSRLEKIRESMLYA